jgi:3-oxoacyl-[acyl-carrier protein] reductase
VTDAAHGIGRAICRLLGQAGASVWAVDILAEELEATVAAVTEAGGHCQPAVVDVTDAPAVQACVDRVLREAGRVDILVNSAGGVCGQVGKAVEEVSDAEWDVVVRTNLYSAFYCIRAVAPAMKRQGGGRIVIISSGAGRSVSLTGIQAYASAKHAVVGLTRQLAHELGPHGITVNSVAPGLIPSNPASVAQWEGYGPAKQRAMLDAIALRRLGTPGDIANAVVFFASPLADFVNGQILQVDGGR